MKQDANEFTNAYKQDLNKQTQKQQERKKNEANFERKEGQEMTGLEFECYQRDRAVEEEKINTKQYLEKQKDQESKRRAEQVSAC
jgi:hypothetical protein